MKNIAISIVCTLLSIETLSAQNISGYVFAKDGKQTEILAGASVYWMNTNEGTTSNGKGFFELPISSASKILIATYLGYSPDTLRWERQSEINFYLTKEKILDEAIVKGEQKAMTISSLGAIKTELLSEKEFRKAACCNLAESFETNPTVEMSYSDGVTGMKQIQLLGLSGKYAQMLVENIPLLNGFMSTNGMSFIPGPWADNLSLAKGCGSVAYGFESLSSQINIGLKNPESGPDLFINQYANVFGRFELNYVSKHKINEKWLSSLLVHGNLTQNQADPNKDGFYNMPSGEGINILNRWRYDGKKWEAQIGLNIMEDFRTAGQIGYSREMPTATSGLYGIKYGNKNYQAWAKLGRPVNELNSWSLGFIQSARLHKNFFHAGKNQYSGTQLSSYSTALATKSFNGCKQELNLGANFRFDRYEETLNNLSFQRSEIVPGIFGELTLKPTSSFTALIGVRGDYHNLFGAFITPRVHLRYELIEGLTFRSSAGRGQRTANIFSENNVIMLSSRKLIMPDFSSGTYGLLPEVAWNYGLNATWDFHLFEKEFVLSADYYWVDFTQQAMIDLDYSPREVLIYNLNGISYTKNFQVMLNVAPLKRMEIRFAYRHIDAQSTYNGVLMQQYLLAKHRGFINIAYSTRTNWSFDLTAQFNGAKRLPLLTENPTEFNLGNFSPTYTIVNAQISKKHKRFEYYTGVENLFNFMQQNLIIDAQNPFGSYFDASFAWGPTMGRLVYAGIRYELPNWKKNKQ